MPAAEEILTPHDLPKSVAVIAGRGAAPRLLVEACERQNIQVFIVGFEEQTDPLLVEGRVHMWSSLGQAGAIMKPLKSHEIADLVMIGAVSRPSLSEIKPDMATAKFIAKVGLSAMGDNDLLGAVKAFLEDEGFRLHGVQKFATELLTPSGALTKAKPSKQDLVDIQRGVDVSQALGKVDVGQAVIVQEGLVLAVEGIEGTTALIQRSVDLKRKDKGGVLVKTCKPQQDKDLDLPTIGPDTIDMIADAGFHGIAVHAGHSLMLEREAVIERANKRKIFILGVEP